MIGSPVLDRITTEGTMKATSDYPLRVPELKELHAAFGTYRAALKATGGSIKLACFYIANPHIAAKAPEAERDSSSPITKPLESAADGQDVSRAWQELPPNKRKRPVSELMRRTGLSRERVNASLHFVWGSKP